MNESKVNEAYRVTDATTVMVSRDAERLLLRLQRLARQYGVGSMMLTERPRQRLICREQAPGVYAYKQTGHFRGQRLDEAEALVLIETWLRVKVQQVAS